MMDIVLATTNNNKIKEIAPLLKGFSWRAIDASWSVDEGQESLISNAMLKVISGAQFLKASGQWVVHRSVVLAEDTGLFVEALGGQPGVMSSRYAGQKCSFADNIDKVLTELAKRDVSNRKAALVTAGALCLSDETILVSMGKLEGEIVQTSSGVEGFGYDSIFFVPEKKRTLAELTFEDKLAISHRAKAMRALLPYLKKFISERGPLTS